jgi:hypothetical protein
LKNKLGLINFGNYEKKRRKFTPEDWFSILQEGEREGRIEKECLSVLVRILHSISGEEKIIPK